MPPMIADEFCDLTFPEGYDEVRFSARQRDPNNDSQTPFLPGDLYLCLLKSKIVNRLYTIRSMSYSEAELLRTVRELDEELESWRLAVPPKYSPALSVHRDVKLDEHLGQTASMLHIELHLEYHHLLHAIHSASSRLTLGVVGPQDHIHAAIQSSLDISSEASRSTMIYLNAAAHRIAADAF